MNTNKSKAHNILEIINLASSARNFIGGQFMYLRQNGYDMHLICSPDDMIQDYATQNQIKYHPVQLVRTLSPWSDIKAFVAICKYIRRNNIDTVIAHQAKARLLGTMAAFLMRVPNRIIFAHGVLFETLNGGKRIFVILMDKIVAMMAHKTVCVSKSVANIRQKYRIESSAQEYFLGAGTCGGIDTVIRFNPDRLIDSEQDVLKKKLGIKDGDFVIGFCGRLVRDKGVAELVDAFKLLKQKYSDGNNLKLFIIGSSELRDSISVGLRKYIDTCNDVIHVERVEYTEIHKYFALFSIMVLPSYREGFGMVTIECGAMEVPAIVSKSTGCIDSIIEDKTGVYCEITPESIADKIELMLKNGEIRTSMGRYSRSWICENFDSSVVWPHIINVIEA